MSATNMPGENMKTILKKAVPMLKNFGLDLDEILQNSLKFLPGFFTDKIKQFQDQDPELKVVIMLTTFYDQEKQQEEIWLVPVGTKREDKYSTIVKEYEPLNLNVFLSQINLEELLNKDDNQ